MTVEKGVGRAWAMPSEHETLMGAVTGGPRRAALRAALSAALLAPLVAAPALAQSTTAPPPSSPRGEPQGSLVVNPQQGATPRPLPPSPSLPAQVPSGSPLSPPPAAQPIPFGPSIAPAPAPPRGDLPTMPTPSPGNDALPRRARPGGLPVPSGDPLHIDAASDPILRLARTQTSTDAFARAIGAADFQILLTTAPR